MHFDGLSSGPTLAPTGAPAGLGVVGALRSPQRRTPRRSPAVSSLSTAQRLILATAADRADGAVLPLPDGFSVRGRARRLMLEGLIKRGLIAERPARGDEPTGAQGDGDCALEITAKGRALVGSAEQEPSSPDDQPLQPASPRPDANVRGPEPDALSSKRPAVRPGTKQALLVDLLRRPKGGTIAEIQQVTGWQPHTARAAITGLKKKSFGVTSAPRRDGVRAYRLIPKHTGHDGDVGQK
jgi:hypothetical protein